MKKCLSVMVMLLLMAVGITGCNSNDNEFIEEEIVAKDELSIRISCAIQEIMENEEGQFDDGGYIIYEAETDNLQSCDVQVYSIAKMIQEGMSKANIVDVKIADPPANQGWTLGGTCRNSAEALRLATQISRKIPKGSNFEIHVETQADGSYKVWYRILK